MSFAPAARRMRRALLLVLAIATVLLALPAASGARTHKSSSCHATSTAHKSAVRKCAKRAHKAKPSHSPHHPPRHHRKHKSKARSTAGAEEAEEESETTCEEGATESEELAACEAPEEEQES